METVFCSTQIPAEERFARWHDLGCRALVATETRTEHATDFQATMRVLDLGAAQVAAMTCPSVWTHRTRRMIRQSDPELFQLATIRQGSLTLAQARQDVSLTNDGMVLYDTSRPFEGRVIAPSGSAELVVAQFPRAFVPLPPNKLEQLVAAPLPADTGLGGLLCTFTAGLTRVHDLHQPIDRIRLGTVLLDLLAVLLARQLDMSESVPPETRRHALLLRIYAFIEQHLDDPQLTPHSIAAAHNISIRQLHNLFRDQSMSVAEWVRHRRLERCRNELLDPTRRSRTIHSIGARWGFPDSAHFSRIFKAAYGMSPAHYRQFADAARPREGANGILSRAARTV